MVEGESFVMSCEVQYTARWDATIECQDNVPGTDLAMDTAGSIPGRSLRAAFTVPAVSSNMHAHSYTCKVKFPAPAPGVLPADDAQNKYDRSPPIYDFTHTSQILNVQCKFYFTTKCLHEQYSVSSGHCRWL